jgi:hypothetical protein
MRFGLVELVNRNTINCGYSIGDETFDRSNILQIKGAILKLNHTASSKKNFP